MGQSFEAHLARRSSAEPRTPARRAKQGGSYLQRWSALSSKGVSFSRNSKAQLTSSVKSYKEPERATWLLGLPAHPQSSMQAHKDTVRYKSLQGGRARPLALDDYMGRSMGTTPHGHPGPDHLRQLAYESLAGCLLSGDWVRACGCTDAQVHAHFPSPRCKSTLLPSSVSPPLPLLLQGGYRDLPAPMPPPSHFFCSPCPHGSISSTSPKPVESRG